MALPKKIDNDKDNDNENENDKYSERTPSKSLWPLSHLITVKTKRKTPSNREHLQIAILDICHLSSDTFETFDQSDKEAKPNQRQIQTCKFLSFHTVENCTAVHCYLTITRDTGQHWQFLWCLNKWAELLHFFTVSPSVQSGWWIWRLK